MTFLENLVRDSQGTGHDTHEATQLLDISRRAHFLGYGSDDPRPILVFTEYLAMLLGRDSVDLSLTDTPLTAFVEALHQRANAGAQVLGVTLEELRPYTRALAAANGGADDDCCGMLVAFDTVGAESAPNVVLFHDFTALSALLAHDPIVQSASPPPLPGLGRQPPKPTLVRRCKAMPQSSLPSLSL